jgi:hypothetical protein
MSPRLVITLAIIAAISIGVGACTFGVLAMALGNVREKESTIIAVGATLLTAGASSLVARFLGGFRELEDSGD